LECIETRLYFTGTTIDFPFFVSILACAALANLGRASSGFSKTSFVVTFWAARSDGISGTAKSDLKTLFTVLTTGGLENSNQPFLQETLAPQVWGRWKNWVELNPDMARQLGVADGDWVWLESSLGKQLLRARLLAGAMPEVASVLLGHEHRAGGEFVTKAAQGVADLVVHRADGWVLTPLGATTRVKIIKANVGGA
jgi:anaerobic selenocysteine-containing dehydrogenase